MAKKKRTAKTKRRARVGGMFPKRYQEGASVAGGVLVGMVIAKGIPAMLTKIAPGVDTRYINGAQAAAGIIGYSMTGKYPVLRGVCIGVGGMGLMDLATTVGVFKAPDVVGADTVRLSLGGGNNYPSNKMAGGIGAQYTGKSYVANKIAGEAGLAYGIYV